LLKRKHGGIAGERGGGWGDDTPYWLKQDKRTLSQRNGVNFIKNSGGSGRHRQRRGGTRRINHSNNRCCSNSKREREDSAPRKRENTFVMATEGIWGKSLPSQKGSVLCWVNVSVQQAAQKKPQRKAQFTRTNAEPENRVEDLQFVTFSLCGNARHSQFYHQGSKKEPDGSAQPDFGMCGMEQR